MMRTTFFLSVCAACLCLLFAAGHRSNLYADSELNVTNENDKTVYTIGPDKTGSDEERKDKERAWDMLKHIQIRTGRPGEEKQQDQPAGTGSPGTGK